MYRSLLTVLGCTTLLLVAGCRHSAPPVRTLQPFSPRMSTATTAKSVVDPAWLKAPTDFFTLGPGDRLEIEVMGEPATRAFTAVAPDGKIYYYLLPGLDVWGLTLSEAKTRLETELVNYIRGEPRVALTLRGVESKRVWLLGRLASPGVYPMTTPMTLLEAIALAGGPANTTSASPLLTMVASPRLTAGGGRVGAMGSLAVAAPTYGGAAPAAHVPAGSLAVASSGDDDLADLSRSFILRDGRRLPIDFQRLLNEGDLRYNIYLQPDDFVYVPTAGTREVYVLGAVLQPQPVGEGRALTLLSAIAGAGGPVKNADLTQVAVVRGSLAEPKVSIVDLRAILKGQAQDVQLESRDIVYVPTTPYRILNRYVDLILETFVRTVGANEGTRAVSRDGAAVGVNVPLGL